MGVSVSGVCKHMQMKLTRCVRRKHVFAYTQMMSRHKRTHKHIHKRTHLPWWGTLRARGSSRRPPATGSCRSGPSQTLCVRTCACVRTRVCCGGLRARGGGGGGGGGCGGGGDGCAFMQSRSVERRTRRDSSKARPINRLGEKQPEDQQTTSAPQAHPPERGLNHITHSSSHT
jgi:hypothetical protein